MRSTLNESKNQNLLILKNEGVTLYDATSNIKPPFQYYFNVSIHTAQLQ